MGQTTGTFSSYDAKGNREDLSDMIYDVSPMETPFITRAAKVKAKATNHEWQTDALNAASATARIEGDEISSYDSTPATTRYGNYTHILRRTGVITDTQESVNKAGRDSEMAYQVPRRLREIKRDMEAVMLDNNAKVTGNDSTAREAAGVPAWIPAANVDKASDGTNATGDGTDARQAGTARALDEAQLKSVTRSIYASSGEQPGVILCSPFNKQVISSFSGNATRMDKSEDKKLYATVDVYVGDFGALEILPSLHCETDNVYVLNMDFWKVAELRPAYKKDMGINGDAEKFAVYWEGTLQASNPKASGLIADVTNS